MSHPAEEVLVECERRNSFVSGVIMGEVKERGRRGGKRERGERPCAEVLSEGRQEGGEKKKGAEKAPSSFAVR